MSGRHWIVAIAVHAGALFALSKVPVRPAAPPPPEPLVEITTLPDPEPDTADTSAASEPAREAVAALSSGSRARTRTPERREPLPSSGPAPEPPPTSDGEPAAPGEGGGAVVPLTARELGLAGGQNPFLPKSERAVALAESKRAVDRALKDPARERDTELGLGPEGPVLAALGEATSRSTAPVRGRAIFVATAGPDGVFAIELGETEGSRAGWDDAKTLALASLRGKKLRLPPGTSRAVMRIEVTSGWKLPSGQDPGTNVRLFRIPIAKGESERSTEVSVLDPIPKLRVTKLPISPGVELPVVSLQVDLFRTNADPANAGAKPRRIVHARLVESQVM